MRRVSCWASAPEYPEAEEVGKTGVRRAGLWAGSAGPRWTRCG